MGWRYWETDDPARRPIKAAHGIKAQTQRGAFGKTWWAGRWIAALERLVDARRLARGRSYARGGQVVKLELGADGVSARVQGSRPQPYRVSIHFTPLSDAAWEKVADAMAAEALYAAKLLSGEMPQEIEEVFAAAGASLFPAARGDLQTSCSCPDWANPCKHVAAVHYLLGEQFDADPFLMFRLRGRTREEIAAALRARRAGAQPLEAGGGQVDAPGEAAVASLGASRREFWSAPGEVAELAFTFEAPAVHALPIKRLGPPPFWRGERDFAAVMDDAYRSIGGRALRLALGEE